MIYGMNKLGGDYNMDCMDIAKTMVKNRVFDINYSINTGCDGGINTDSIKLYYEIYDFAKRFYEKHLYEVLTPTLYNDLLLGIEKIANDYNCNISFDIEDNLLNVIIQQSELKVAMEIEDKYNKNNKKIKRIINITKKRLSDDDEKYLRECCTHIDVEKMVKWVDKKMDEEFNKGYDAGADYYMNY
jgi:hypothetical protein